jgi:hypothetical protein
MMQPNWTDRLDALTDGQRFLLGMGIGGAIVGVIVLISKVIAWAEFL